MVRRPGKDWLRILPFIVFAALAMNGVFLVQRAADVGPVPACEQQADVHEDFLCDEAAPPLDIRPPAETTFRRRLSRGCQAASLLCASIFHPPEA